ncbi:MAG: DAHL domain-containing protein [Cyanophyceae cyanobacterium]
MKKISWRNLCIPLFAVILVVALIVKSLPVYFGNHRQYQQALGLQREEKALLSQELLKSRYELFFSYDPLVAYITALKNLQNQLQVLPPLPADKKRQYQALLQADTAALEQVENLLEEFKIQNSTLKNSLRYLPSLATESSNYRFSEVFSDLAQNLLLYELTSSEELSATIKASLEQLQQLQEQSFGEERALIELASRHAAIILNYKPKVDQEVQQLLEQLSPQQNGKLSMAYHSYYQEAVAAANTYLRFAYGGFLLLLGWIAYAIISHILKLLNKSQQAEAKLQQMNEELEARVKQRTAQLSELLALECLSEKKQRREKEKLKKQLEQLQGELGTSRDSFISLNPSTESTFRNEST